MTDQDYMANWLSEWFGNEQLDTDDCGLVLKSIILTSHSFDCFAKALAFIHSLWVNPSKLSGASEVTGQLTIWLVWECTTGWSLWFCSVNISAIEHNSDQLSIWLLCPSLTHASIHCGLVLSTWSISDCTKSSVVNCPFSCSVQA